MAAFRDDMPLVAGVNEDWDEFTTGTQIMRPDWDFSPIRMRTMHHLPQIFFDTLLVRWHREHIKLPWARND